MSAWKSRLRATGSFLKEMAGDWMEDNVLRLSAALAYYSYSIFSIAPLLVIALGIAGWVLGPDAVRGHLDDQLRAMMGPEAAKAVQSLVQSASKPSDSAWATAIGFLTLLLGASGVFGQLKDALNTIWEVKALRSSGLFGFVKERLLSFGMVLVIGFLLLTSLVLTTALAALMKYFGGMFPISEAAVGITGFVVSAGIVTTLFALIFKVLPDANVCWRHVWIGAAVTALFFEIGKFLLGFYLGRQSTASSYGAAGSVVLVLLWVLLHVDDSFDRSGIHAGLCKGGWTRDRAGGKCGSGHRRNARAAGTPGKPAKVALTACMRTGDCPLI